MSIRGIFKKVFENNEPEEARAERDFQAIARTVKDLDRQGINKYTKAVIAIWEGYKALRDLKTIDEKEVEAVDKVENSIEFLEGENDN